MTDEKEFLLSFFDRETSIKKIIARIKDSFTENAECVLLSTAHKIKGAEAPRIAILGDTFKRRGGEEENLRYVAITRAKDEVYFVGQAVTL
jgi:superfamily I DNA/RNA helicase